jgi:hypothetical protein
MLQTPLISTVYKKTLQGHAELYVRSQGLSMLDRRVLILTDGARSLGQLQEMLNFSVPEVAARLQAQGLLAVVPVVPSADKPSALAQHMDDEVDVGSEDVSEEDLASDFSQEWEVDEASDGFMQSHSGQLQGTSA